MKKLIILLLILSLGFVSATDLISSFLHNSTDYSIVVSESLSPEENAAAQNLSDQLGIMLINDTDVTENTSLFVIGSPDKNLKAEELGDSSQGDFYQKDTNYFISGNSSFNAQKIEEILLKINENSGETADVSIGESAQDTPRSEPKVVITNSSSSSGGKINYKNLVPAIFLAIFAVFIVVLFVLAFKKRPQI